jgi:universal stress protein A
MAGYKKIMVLLDLSKDSGQVVRAARDLAAYSQASLIAIHVVEFVPIAPMGDPLIPSTGLEPNLMIESELIEGARQRLRALLIETGLPTAPMRVEAGPIKAQILRVAGEENPDLIVVGSHEHHGLAVLVNFTQDAVLHAAHCDVLAVRLR